MSASNSFVGRVTKGRGLGAPLMSEPRVLDLVNELMGLLPVPGTLNVRLAEPFDRSLIPHFADFAKLSGQLGIDLVAETGQTGLWWAPVLIEGQYRGVVFQAEQDGYSPDLVELFCETHLRGTLDLNDGDLIQFSILDDE